MSALTVAATISSKDRFFTTLPMVFSAVLNQTLRPNKIIIYNDGQDFDPNNNDLYRPLCLWAQEQKVDWMIAFGAKRGQVANHQSALLNAGTDLIWRLDDDTVPEATTLQRLIAPFTNEEVGAVAGLVLHPGGVQECPKHLTGKIEDIAAEANKQWYRHPQETPFEVDHLYSTFLFRREAALAAGGYNLKLSPVGHREETMFSHQLKRAGYKLLVDPKAVSWHLRASHGGIRSYKDSNLWQHDEQVFQEQLKEWGVKTRGIKLIVLEGGIGDHLALRQVYPEIKAKHLDKKMIVAAAYPYVFQDVPDMRLISIAEAKQCFGDLLPFNIYKFMADRQWTTSLLDAYRAMYL